MDNKPNDNTFELLRKMAAVQCRSERLTLIITLVTLVMAAVLIFGEMDGRLERKWMFVGLGGVMLSIVPSILVTLTPFPNWAGVLVNLLITAAVVYITIKLVKQYMPEELKSLSYSHRRNRHKKDDDKPQKMPKIVMPDK